MPNKLPVRTLMDSQLVKRSERLLKSSPQYVCHIFWSLGNKINPTNSVLVVSQILRLFVNVLTPNDKYSLSVKASVSHNQFECNYLKLKKYSLNFQNLCKIRDTFKKKMSPRGYLFLKLKTSKSRVT